MLSDISNSIKANLYERATSPLFGTFLVSWCVWNYKTIFILFSALPVKEKFIFIDNQIYVNLSSSLGIGIVYPLVTALLFIFLYPLPSKYIYKYWHEKQKELKEIKQSIDDETPLTIEESRQIRRELLKLEAEYYNELASKEAEIERLKNDLVEINTSAKKPKEKPVKTEKKPALIKQKQPSLSEEQIEIIKLLTKKDGSAFQQELIAASKFDKVKTEYYIEDLTNKNYIRTNYHSNYGDYKLSLTTQGKQVAVEMGFVK